MSRARKLFNYPGGAWQKSGQIIKLLPNPSLYDTLVEPYCGSASTFVRMEHTPRHVVLGDTNAELVNFFIALRDREDDLVQKLSLTLWSQEEWKMALEPCDDPLERARRFYVRMEMSRRPYDTSPSFKNNYMVARKSDGTGPMTMPSRRWSEVGHLRKFAARIQLAHIENRDAFEIMEKYAYARSLFILDPPWLTTTRVNKTLYKGEDGGDNVAYHIELIRRLLEMPGHWCVLGNRSELYDDMLDGWAIRVLLKSRNDAGAAVEEVMYKNW